MTARLAAVCPAPLRPLLGRYLRGEISPEIMLMHLALQPGEAGLSNALLGSFQAAEPRAKKLVDLARLAAAHADHLAQVTALARRGLTTIPSIEGDRVIAIRDQFETAVAVAPEAAVALYSLGSAEILDRSTDEIVARFAEWGLLLPEARVLDIGCGIGRLEQALAPHVGMITGLDVSFGMIATARRRCRHLANIAFVQSSGRDLAGFTDGSFDLVLAVDSFPYLVAADPAIAARHVGDAARLLQPGGAFVILNFSYRGDDEADRREVETLAAAHGFVVERAGSRDFTLWDGLSFLLRLPASRE